MAFHRGCDRRCFLIGALGAAPALLKAKDFWETKDPSAWTEEEILSLTSKSPWAKLAEPDYKGAGESTRGAAIRGGRSGPRQPDAPNIGVRWESAQPILDALKTRLPPEFDGYYVLGVSNLPIAGIRPSGRAGDAPDDALERLQNGAALEAKGKDPVESGVARRTRGGEILLGFSKDFLHLAATDREIIFGLAMEKFSIKARFDGKDMVYRGKLAV
jgi:hypothetical protein